AAGQAERCGDRVRAHVRAPRVEQHGASGRRRRRQGGPRTDPAAHTAVDRGGAAGAGGTGDAVKAAGGSMERTVTLVLLAAVALALPLAAQVGAPQDARPLRIFIRAGEKTHNPVDNGIHDYPAFLADWSKLLLTRGATVDGALHFPTVDELARTDVLV